MKVVSDDVAHAAAPRILVKIILAVAVLGAIIAGGVYLRPLIAEAGTLVRDQGAVGALLYVFIVAAAVVIVPLSSLPLLPVVAAAWGVLLGGTLSVVGWWLGSLAAFLIARRLGRPILAKVLRLSKLEELERRLPAHTTFVSIILIRLVFPVEIPSYVLGLTKAVRFRPYALASLLGMIPFAFVMVAMGGAIAAGEWFVFTATGVAALAIIYGLYLVWRRHMRLSDNATAEGSGEEMGEDPRPTDRRHISKGYRRGHCVEDRRSHYFEESCGRPGSMDLGHKPERRE